MCSLISLSIYGSYGFGLFAGGSVRYSNQSKALSDSPKQTITYIKANSPQWFPGYDSKNSVKPVVSSPTKNPINSVANQVHTKQTEPLRARADAELSSLLATNQPKPKAIFVELPKMPVDFAIEDKNRSPESLILNPMTQTPGWSGSFSQDKIHTYVIPDGKELVTVDSDAIAPANSNSESTVEAMVLISGLYDFPQKIKNNLPEDVKTQYFAEVSDSIKAQEERSALYSADKIRTPALIINGEKDDRTDPQQAKLLSQKIQNNGIYSKALIYPEYGHQIPVEVRNKEIIPFFDQYLLK